MMLGHLCKGSKRDPFWGPGDSLATSSVGMCVMLGTLLLQDLSDAGFAGGKTGLKVVLFLWK